MVAWMPPVGVGWGRRRMLRSAGRGGEAVSGGVLCQAGTGSGRAVTLRGPGAHPSHGDGAGHGRADGHPPAGDHPRLRAGGRGALPPPGRPDGPQGPGPRRPPFDDGDLELACAFKGRIGDIEERAVFNRRVAEARAHVGHVHTVPLVALTLGLERALVYRGVAVWAEERRSCLGSCGVWRWGRGSAEARRVDSNQGREARSRLPRASGLAGPSPGWDGTPVGIYRAESAGDRFSGAIVTGAPRVSTMYPLPAYRISIRDAESVWCASLF